MTQKLSKDIATALHAAGIEGLQVVDPDTNRIYIILDEETHRRAMNALRAQQDHNAITEGIEQMEAGQGMPAEQALIELRTRLGFAEEA